MNNNNKIFHCLFEQSGTFKNEFKKLGYIAYDYDILNHFGETDFVIDLYNEILKGYEHKPSIFDKITKDDTILAFFPCVRFENQIILYFKGTNHAQAKWDVKQKLEYDLKLHNELNQNYELITKLALICIEREISLIIENPYSTQHYLTRYWGIEPSIIDEDRTAMGDYFKKPTQYWFINCKPKYNFIFEGVDIKRVKRVALTSDKVERSMISKDYANRFIREYII